ncbi:MAG: 30S ribosome-binding factor RbfA [Acidimicrobiales bacterium]
MPSGRDYPRTLRVNEVLRQVVAEELERLADADERLRLVTVTSVQVSPDLRAATVYVGTLEDETSDALEAHRTQLQRAVGTQVRMKRTPRLTFTADPAVSAGARVEEILRRLGEERAARRAAGAPGTGPAAGGPPAR